MFDPLSLQQSVKMVVYLGKDRLSQRLCAKVKKYLSPQLETIG